MQETRQYGVNSVLTLTTLPMKYIDEFRDQGACQRLARQIAGAADGREMTLMEVCGTHTMSIFRYGIQSLLPSNIRLLSGPGCPVCVTPNQHIDRAIAYSRKADLIVATFGDLMKVPGSSSSLAREKSLGADVRVVYWVGDALRLALENPNQAVVFLGIGFETTAPTVAASLWDADQKRLANYFVLTMHKLIPPAIKAILDSGEVEVNGFLLPGHVSTIIGTQAYEFIPREYGIPCVATGFEPTDVLQAVLMLAKQTRDGRSEVENQYARAVKREGNLKARALLNEVFEPVDSEWRGLGTIPVSGLSIREPYARFDAEKNIEAEVEETKEDPNCICGDILRGVKNPEDCDLFGKSCTPESPIGPCMVSSEGTCAAHYKYGQNETGC